jgi:hypothetical protein
VRFRIELGICATFETGLDDLRERAHQTERVDAQTTHGDGHSNQGGQPELADPYSEGNIDARVRRG